LPNFEPRKIQCPDECPNKTVAFDALRDRGEVGNKDGGPIDLPKDRIEDGWIAGNVFCVLIKIQSLTDRYFESCVFGKVIDGRLQRAFNERGLRADLYLIAMKRRSNGPYGPYYLLAGPASRNALLGIMIGGQKSREACLRKVVLADSCLAKAEANGLRSDQIARALARVPKTGMLEFPSVLECSRVLNLAINAH
jgi:hypothetical protein